jgi:hypothetical protein
MQKEGASRKAVAGSGKRSLEVGSGENALHFLIHILLPVSFGKPSVRASSRKFCAQPIKAADDRID